MRASMQRCSARRTCRPTLPLLQGTAGGTGTRGCQCRARCACRASLLLMRSSSGVQPCCRAWPLPQDCATRPAPNRQASPGCAALRTAIHAWRPPTRHDVEVVQALVDLAGQYLDSRVAAAAAVDAGQGGAAGAVGSCNHATGPGASTSVCRVAVACCVAAEHARRALAGRPRF